MAGVCRLRPDGRGRRGPGRGWRSRPSWWWWDRRNCSSPHCTPHCGRPGRQQSPRGRPVRWWAGRPPTERWPPAHRGRAGSRADGDERRLGWCRAGRRARLGRPARCSPPPDRVERRRCRADNPAAGRRGRQVHYWGDGGGRLERGR